MVNVHVALNGRRSLGAHRTLPITPEEAGREAARARRAGAVAVHVHPRDRDARESLDAVDVAATVLAIREAAPGLPISISLGAWIEPDPARRAELIAAWPVRPDLATVDVGDPAAAILVDALEAVGVGVELSVRSGEDVNRADSLGLFPRGGRVVMEPDSPAIVDALGQVSEVLDLLDRVAPGADRLLCGHDLTVWPLVGEAIARGVDVRVGLGDTLRLPDGSAAPDNQALVRTVFELEGSFEGARSSTRSTSPDLTPPPAP